MNQAIGILMRNGAEIFYATINGNHVENTVANLELLLQGKEPVAAVEAPKASKKAEGKTYTVTLTFQFPAWDEKDGIVYRDIVAGSKKDAIARVRRMASGDGHAVGGRGMYWLSAEEDKKD